MLILQGEDVLENRTLKKVLDALLNVHVAYGAFDEIVEPLARRIYVDPDKLPLLIVTVSGMKAIYGCSGYKVGSVELMGRALRKCTAGERQTIPCCTFPQRR